MSRKRQSLRDSVSQILYACSGDDKQHEETINAIIGAMEVYVRELTRVALLKSENAKKLSDSDFKKALENDPEREFIFKTIDGSNSVKPRPPQ